MLAVVPACGVDTLAAAAGLGGNTPHDPRTATPATPDVRAHPGGPGAGLPPDRWRRAAVFGLFEGLMPVAGALLGGAAGHLAGHWAGRAGGLLLAVLAVRELWEGLAEIGEGNSRPPAAGQAAGSSAAGAGPERPGRGAGSRRELSAASAGGGPLAGPRAGGRGARREGRAAYRTGPGALVAGGLAVSLDELAVGAGAGTAGAHLAVLALALAGQAAAFTLLGLAAGARLRRAVGRYGELASGALLLAAALAVGLGWL